MPDSIPSTSEILRKRLSWSLITLTRVLETGDLGPFFYRFNRPGEISTR